MSRLRRNYTLQYFSIGALFGFFFPVFATTFLLLHEHLPVSWSVISELHTTRPLLLIIDTAPLFLGLFALVAGMKQEIVVEYNESLREVNAKLEQEIAEKEALAQQYEQAKIKAEGAAAAKSQFLSIMSHEIRTPLNAVIGMSHSLLEDNPRPEQVEDMQILKFTAEGLRVLVSDILDFNKIDAGKVQLEETPFNLRQLVTNLQRSLASQIQKKNVQLETRFEEAIPNTLVGDPVRISQIILNLISNAIKFTEQGSVSVAFTLQEIVEEQARLRCTVRDTGIGIAPEELDRIFDSFSQANVSTTRKYGGTGLGLAITQKLLAMYNSRISVESVVGQGSTFSFLLTLPIASELPVTEERDFQMPGVRILLVEDNDINVLIAQKLLERWQVELDVATDGQEAVERVQQNEYDIILMDLQMPVMDGYEATRQIRQLEAPDKQSVPIIALTASALAEEQEKVQAAGMDDCVTKPISPKRLGNMIMKHTRGRHGSPRQ